MTETGDGLADTARLLGVLWLREVDQEFLSTSASPEVRAALSGLGLELPASDDPAALDELAASYFAEIVQPEGRPPPVQSLVIEGKYEGSSAAGVRKVADALGVDLDVAAARGAAVDHLGVELCLWAELLDRSPDSATDFARTFLEWSIDWCDRHARGIDGFYGRLFAVSAEFARVALEPVPGD